MLLSIIVPVRNEITHISKSFNSIIKAASKLESEIFFVDGKSNDGTYEWLRNVTKTINNCKLVINNEKYVSYGFNQVFNETKGKYISRIDGHTIYPENYFSNAINILKNQSIDVVGGPAKHIGTSWKGEIIATCMMHPFGTGNSKFRISKKEQFVYTVPFPIYRREVLKKIGLYDEELIKNQDDELNYRCVANGFKILMSPALTTKYLVRENAFDLSKQYYLYGLYKPFVFKKVNYGYKIYNYVPAFHLLFSFLSLILFPLANYSVYYILCYLIFSLIFSYRKTKGIRAIIYGVLIFATIHYSYGIGFIAGYFKSLIEVVHPGKKYN